MTNAIPKVGETWIQKKPLKRGYTKDKVAIDELVQINGATWVKYTNPHVAEWHDSRRGQKALSHFVLEYKRDTAAIQSAPAGSPAL